MSAAQPSFHPAPSAPTIALPKGACDTHCHVFGPQARFPYPEGVAFRPADAPKERLFALHDKLGIERCVIVQSGCHGFDNSAMLDAMAARPGRYLGIALVPIDVSDTTLADLAAKGVRGVRFNFMPHLQVGASAQDIVAFSHRLVAHDMHLQIHVAPTLIAETGATLADAATPVVIDHMARINAAEGPDQAPFAALMALMENEKFLVKVSGSERASAPGAPYDDAVPFAQRLVQTYPDRVLWGTDWPHPNLAGGPPDDGVLVDLIARIAPDPGHLTALMVDNPARFYRFEV